MAADDSALHRIAGLLPRDGRYRVEFAIASDIDSLSAHRFRGICLIDIGAGGADMLAHARGLAARPEGCPPVILHAITDAASIPVVSGAADLIPFSEATPFLLDRVLGHVVERYCLRHALYHTRRELKAVLEHGSVIFFATDRSGVVTALYGRMPGGRDGAVAGASVFDVYPDETAFLRNVARALGGETFNDVISLDGLIYDCRYEPTYDIEGVIDGMMGVATSLTERTRGCGKRRRIEDAPCEANDRLELRVQERTAEIMHTLARLEQVHAAQQQFIADASHDLRTPLTVIRAEADLLLSRRATDADVADAVNVIRNEALRLDDITRDMLLLASLDGHPAPEFRCCVRMDTLLRDIVRQLGGLAGARGIICNIHINDELEYCCDARMMESAMINALENAIKYSRDNGVVDVSLERGGDAIVITVRDRGIGISSAEIGRVFERFYRSDAVRSVPGTGLGLSIIKAVMDRHGGSVRIESAPECGTTVIMELPAIAPPQKRYAASQQ